MHTLLASKDPSLRLALELLLHEEPGLTVAGAASETEGLLALVQTTGPDLVLVEWDLPGRPMANVLAKISAAQCSPKAIVLGDHPVDRVLAMEAGAYAYVVKGERPENLRAVLHEIVAERGHLQTKKPDLPTTFGTSPR